MNDHNNDHKWIIEIVINYDQRLKLAGQVSEIQKFNVEHYNLDEEETNQYMLTSPATRTLEAVFYIINLDYDPRKIPK